MKRAARGILPTWGPLLSLKHTVAIAPLPPIPNTDPIAEAGGGLPTGPDNIPIPVWDLPYDDDLEELEANLESASAVGAAASSMPSARYVRSDVASARLARSEQLQSLPFRLPSIDLELMNSPIKEASREFSVGGLSNLTLDREQQQPQIQNKRGGENSQHSNDGLEKELDENEKKPIKSEVSDDNKTLVLPPMVLPPLPRAGVESAPRAPIVLKRAANKTQEKENVQSSIFMQLRSALAKGAKNDEVQFLSGLEVRRKEVLRHHKSRRHHRRRRQTSRAVSRMSTVMSRTRTGTTVRFSRRGTTATTGTTADSVYELTEVTDEHERKRKPGGEQSQSESGPGVQIQAVQKSAIQADTRTHSQTAATTQATPVASATEALIRAPESAQEAKPEGGDGVVDAVEYMNNVRELKTIKFKQVINSPFMAYKLQKTPYKFELYEMQRGLGGNASHRKANLVPILRGYTPFDSTPPSNKKIYRLERLKQKAQRQYLESQVQCANFEV